MCDSFRLYPASHLFAQRERTIRGMIRPVTWALKHESFAADSKLVQALEKRSLPVACGKGGTLFIQGETPKGLYILQRGEAALVMKSRAGRTVMCLHAGSGSLLGLPGVIGKEPYTLTAWFARDLRYDSSPGKTLNRSLKRNRSYIPAFFRCLRQKSASHDWRLQRTRAAISVFGTNQLAID